MYGQLVVFAPIMMALTGSTPILWGCLADTNCRWGIISESVDDRTEAKRGIDTVSDQLSRVWGSGGFTNRGTRRSRLTSTKARARD